MYETVSCVPAQVTSLTTGCCFSSSLPCSPNPLPCLPLRGSDTFTTGTGSHSLRPHCPLSDLPILGQILLCPLPHSTGKTSAPAKFNCGGHAIAYHVGSSGAIACEGWEEAPGHVLPTAPHTASLCHWDAFRSSSSTNFLKNPVSPLSSN